MRTKFFENYLDGSFDDIVDLKQYIQYDIEKAFYNHISKNKEYDVTFDIDDEFTKLVNQYVRDFGASDTEYGEIIRGINKLIYRYYNDGDDIETGSYSGIMVGLRNFFEISFTLDGEAVSYSGEYENCNDDFNTFALSQCKLNSNMSNYAKMLEYLVKSMKFATILLGYTERYENCNNRYYISDYYNNIVNFIIDENIIKIFKEEELDITDKFGCYDKSYIYNETITINDRYENIFIIVNYNKVKFKFFSNHYKLEFVSNNLNELKDNINKYKSLLRYIFEHKDDESFDVDYLKSLEVSETL